MVWTIVFAALALGAVGILAVFSHIVAEAMVEGERHEDEEPVQGDVDG